MFSISIICCGKNVKGEPLKAHIMLYDTLQSKEFSIGDGACSFRIVALADKFFSFRKPDYNGGFFFGLQIASATQKERNKNTEFDKIKEISNYIIYAKEDLSVRGGTWHIPHYNMYYINIKFPLDISTFDLDSYAGDWLPYREAEARSILPQDIMVLANLNVYSSEERNRDETIQWNTYVDSQNSFSMEAMQSEVFDLDLIETLKSSAKYDTIIQTATSNLYYNTDLEVCEQPLVSNVFYIIRKKFHSNGIIKEKHFFYPGVYTSNSLPVYSVYFDERGNGTSAKDYLLEYKFMGNIITVKWLMKLLEREKQVDFQTGDGRATMIINKDVNPYAIGTSERLSIRSKWQITTDDDLHSSVGLLIKHKDESETVYLIDKPTRIILKKFKR